MWMTNVTYSDIWLMFICQVVYCPESEEKTFFSLLLELKLKSTIMLVEWVFYHL